MKNVMGVIYTGEKDSFLRELTLLRAIAAMPDEPARLRFWQQATDGRVQRLVQAADEEAAERLLEELLEAERTACATL